MILFEYVQLVLKIIIHTKLLTSLTAMDGNFSLERVDNGVQTAFTQYSYYPAW